MRIISRFITPRVDGIDVTPLKPVRWRIVHADGSYGEWKDIKAGSVVVNNGDRIEYVQFDVEPA
jgi:hypothetical protein